MKDRALSDIPIVRKSDPDTSRIAADEMNLSGARVSQIQQVRDALGKFPGHTSYELAGLADMDRYACERRLSDLKAMQEAFAPAYKKRICYVSGRMALTWYPVDPEAETEESPSMPPYMIPAAEYEPDEFVYAVAA